MGVHFWPPPPPPIGNRVKPPMLNAEYGDAINPFLTCIAWPSTWTSYWPSTSHISLFSTSSYLSEVPSSIPSFRFLNFLISIAILPAFSVQDHQHIIIPVDTLIYFKYHNNKRLSTNPWWTTLYHKLITKCTIYSTQSAQPWMPLFNTLLVHCLLHYISWYPVKNLLQAQQMHNITFSFGPSTSPLIVSIKILHQWCLVLAWIQIVYCPCSNSVNPLSYLVLKHHPSPCNYSQQNQPPSQQEPHPHSQ